MLPTSRNSTGLSVEKIHPGVKPELLVPMRVTMFWRAVSVAEPDQCWEWQGYRDDAGYGLFQWEGRMRPAHELALTFTTGEVRAPSFDTCHSCHNPPCCNPNHLRFDTRQGNVDDCVAAGRNYKPRKLTDEQVAAIRQRIENGARQQDLAKQYGVCEATITDIKLKRRAYSNR